MRIALVLPAVNWTEGVPHYTAALAKALSREHEVHIFAGRYEAYDPGAVNLHKISTLPWGNTVFHATFVANMYLRHVSRFLSLRNDFDVVHGAGYTCPFANVTTAHFIQVREQRLLKRDFPTRRRYSWREALGRFDYRLYGYFSSMMEKRMYRTSGQNAIIAISGNVKHDLVEEFGLSDGRIEIIPNGVDTVRFHPTNRLLFQEHTRRQLGLDKTHIVGIFVGNSWERKGLRLAIDAVLAIPNPKLKLLIVGSGDSRNYPALSNMRDSDSRIILVDGPVRQIEKYYAAADFLLFPTLYEPFGMVVLEAMANGLPVIASAVSGVAEHIIDMETGILIHDPLDANEVRAKVELLIDDVALRNKLAVQGRLLSEKFTWDRVAQLTIKVYESVLGGGVKADRTTEIGVNRQ